MPTLPETLRSHNIDTTAFSSLATIGDHELFSLTTPGSRAVDLWKKLRTLTPITSHFPLIIGNPDDLDEQLQLANEESSTVDSILASAERIHIPDEMKQKRELDPEFYEDLDEGEWPAKIPHPTEHFTIPTNIRTGQFTERCTLALIPTTDPTAIPAFLRYGGWNDCPHADVHVAWFRHWHNRHGAEIIGATRDVVEMIVSRRPTTREAALELAREQYAYCYDIVDQGVGTIANLAATLLNSPSWYFWWD